MSIPKPKLTRLMLMFAAAGAAAHSLQAQDYGRAILDALVQKGVLTAGEAQQAFDQAVKANSGADVITNSADKFVKKLTLTGRFQFQYAGLGTGIDNGINPPSTEHFLLRRMYLGTRVDLTQSLYGQVVYDFANSSFDSALVGWKESDALSIEAGLRKAPYGYEETTSSGALKAIERSTVTRWFDESDNGRRLGAASYRVGVFASGTEGLFFYNAALTNPERNEYSGDGTSGPAVNGNPGVQAAGGASNNKFAVYGMGGITDKLDSGFTYKVGVEGGYLPDQGGPGATVGVGNGITLYGAFADLTSGNATLVAEYMAADDHNGVAPGTSAKPKGFWIQPSYYFIPKVLEGVVRYSAIDSDRRGVQTSDGIRSAPGGGTMNKLNEWYLGGNWYIDGNDFKFQLGYIHGETTDSTALVQPALRPKATVDGLRSQVQVNF